MTRDRGTTFVCEERLITTFYRDERRELIKQSKDINRTQQQRPESPVVTLTY